MTNDSQTSDHIFSITTYTTTHTYTYKFTLFIMVTEIKTGWNYNILFFCTTIDDQEKSY